MLFPLWKSLTLTKGEAKGVVIGFGERVCRSKVTGCSRSERLCAQDQVKDVERS
jgi:hypothetical protein